MVPVQADWARLTARWWHRVMRNPHWLAHKAMKESIQLSCGRGASAGTPGSDCRFWYARFASSMHQLGLPVDNSSAAAAAGNAFPEGSVVAALHTLHGRSLAPYAGADPRLRRGAGAMRCKYVNWVYDGSFGAHVLHPERRTRTFAPHMRCVSIPQAHQRALARLRAGCWPIAVNAGRGEGVDRPERVCAHCSTNGSHHVEDEMHVLCDCPRFANLRARFSDLFVPGIACMKVVLNHHDTICSLRVCRVQAAFWWRVADG